MRQDNDKKPVKCLDILFKKGGLGDSVARLPAVHYILVKNPHIKKARLFLQDYFVDMAKLLLKPHMNSKRLRIYGYSEMEAQLKAHPSKHGVMTDTEHHNTLHTHLTDHAFHTLANTMPADTQWKSYLSIDRRPYRTKHKVGTNYVVVTCGFTAPNREWPSSHINKVVDWLVEQGITPVFLGKTENVFWGDASTQGWFREDINFDKGINLIDKTTLPEAARIMQQARAVIGLDNGLLHLAACTDVPIVALYTTVAKEHRMPYRYGTLGYRVYPIEPPPTLSCRLCQTQMTFVYEFDFRHCYYNDYKCLHSITVEDTIKGIKEVLTWPSR